MPIRITTLILATLAGTACRHHDEPIADAGKGNAAKPITPAPGPAGPAAVDTKPVAAAPAQPALAPFKEKVPAAAYEIEMIPIPGDAARGIKPFWIGKTELTFDAADVWIYNLDGERKLPDLPADSHTRPSKPYLPPDRGFGHEDYAAICISYVGASEFCRWLSARTGRKYRLPTEDEWEYACRAGTTTKYSFGDDESKLGDYAWFAANAEDTTHKTATKKPNPWGLYDMHGNVQEWCVGKDGKPVTRGGSFRDDPKDLTSASRALEEPDWRASDPQIPKSKYWLTDGSHVGFRIVCEPTPAK